VCWTTTGFMAPLYEQVTARQAFAALLGDNDQGSGRQVCVDQRRANAAINTITRRPAGARWPGSRPCARRAADHHLIGRASGGDAGPRDLSRRAADRAGGSRRSPSCRRRACR
jgi:hypothetical protein